MKERPFATSMVKIGKRGVARTGVLPQQQAEDRAGAMEEINVMCFGFDFVMNVTCRVWWFFG